jgi:hypothetical protein
MPNVNKIKADLRAEVNAMKIKNPEAGKKYENWLFKTQEIEKGINIDPEKFIKYYPGSPKGPNPEDDPQHYSEWFMRNQPVKELYGD